MNSLIVLCAGILGTAAAPQAGIQQLDKTACAGCPTSNNTVYAPPTSSYQTNSRPSGYRQSDYRLPVAQSLPGSYSAGSCANGQCNLSSRYGTTGYTASNPYPVSNGYSSGTDYCPTGQSNLSSRYGTTCVDCSNGNCPNGNCSNRNCPNGNCSGLNNSQYGSQYDSRYNSGYGSRYPSSLDSRYNSQQLPGSDYPSALDSRYPSNTNFHTRYNLDSSNRYNEGYNTRDRYSVSNYRSNQPYLTQSPRSPYFN